MKSVQKEEGIQINKYISNSGFCSRREAEKLIEQARVTINDEMVLLTARVYPGDVVAIDGEKIKNKQKPIYIALNKPVGVTSTTDETDKSNIIRFMNHPKRIFPVGRLDKDSEGLILLTNDGDLTFRATHPSYGLEKTYIIEFDGKLPTGVDKALLKGVELEDGMWRVLAFKHLSPQWLEVTIHEGRYHIIRRLMEAVGVDVLRLIRTRFGPISLGETLEGRWRDLNSAELISLQKALDIN